MIAVGTNPMFRVAGATRAAISTASSSPRARSVREVVLAAQAAAGGIEPAEIERRMAGRNLTRTLIDASQVATVIAFLASPLSVSINGESIACGGGTPGVIRY